LIVFGTPMNGGPKICDIAGQKKNKPLYINKDPYNDVLQRGIRGDSNAGGGPPFKVAIAEIRIKIFELCFATMKHSDSALIARIAITRGDHEIKQ